MLTDLIKDRIVRASLEVNNTTDAVARVLETLTGPNKTTEISNHSPVNPESMSLSRAVDLLEEEVNRLQREVSKFRGDEPEQETKTISLGRR